MEVKFGETNIHDDFSVSVATIGYAIGPANVAKVASSLFGGVSEFLSAVKNTSIPKGLIFAGLDGSFIAGAKVEYIKNSDDSDPAAGHWNYSWTTISSDMNDSDNIIVSQDIRIYDYFASNAFKHFHMRFVDAPTCITMMTTLVEMIIHFIRENTKPNDGATLVLDGVFKAFGEVESDGSVSVAIIPDGDMKVLIKDDSAIQAA
jgi:hypothetical protein